MLKQLREPLNWSEIWFDNKDRGECLDQTGTRAAHSSFVATAHYWLYTVQPVMCTTSNVYNVQHHIRLSRVVHYKTQVLRSMCARAIGQELSGWRGHVNIHVSFFSHSRPAFMSMSMISFFLILNSFQTNIHVLFPPFLSGKSPSPSTPPRKKHVFWDLKDFANIHIAFLSFPFFSPSYMSM